MHMDTSREQIEMPFRNSAVEDISDSCLSLMAEKMGKQFLASFYHTKYVTIRYFGPTHHLKNYLHLGRILTSHTPVRNNPYGTCWCLGAHQLALKMVHRST